MEGVPHFASRAKRVIFLCMAGGPSHLETFDYKPKLDELNGQPMPASFTKGQPIAQLQGQALKVQGHLCKFGHHGESGQLISDYLPHTAKIADDIAIIRSMVTEQINHDPAHTFMNTGTAISGRPSMGSWINYGLGSETDDLQASSCSPASAVAIPSRLPPASGPRAFSPVAIRASSSTLPAIPFITCATLRVFLRRSKLPWSTPSSSSIESEMPLSPIPRSTLESPPTKWPFACRRPSPN